MFIPLPKLNQKGLTPLLPIIIVILIIAAALGGYYFLNSNNSKTTPQTPTPAPKKIGIIQYFKTIDIISDGFKEGMKDLGYVEGKNVVYEYESAEGDFKKLKEISQKYLNEKVDLIYAITSVSALFAYNESTASGKTIPIVVAQADNPDKIGLVKSFKSSGNQVTGVAANLSELTAKKLEFLQRMNPKISKIGVFNAKITDRAAMFALNELKAQAPKFNMTVVEYPVTSTDPVSAVAEITKITDVIKPGEIDAWYQVPGNIIFHPDSIKQVNKTNNRLKIPSANFADIHVTNGGLFSYGHDQYALGKQTASAADKILKGAKPSDIPLEFPAKNIFAINLKTAKLIDLTIPEDLLSIADKKVE